MMASLGNEVHQTNQYATQHDDEQQERVRSDCKHVADADAEGRPMKNGATTTKNGDADVTSDIAVTGNDVLLGRGGKNNKHEGNEQLRTLSSAYAPFYRAAYKREKPAIALLLVQQVHALTPPGR